MGSQPLKHLFLVIFPVTVMALSALSRHVGMMYISEWFGLHKADNNVREV